MQIVIDIPEDTYTYWINEPHERILADAIKNGKPLLKGHGRLIDADEYFKGSFGDAREFLDKATTIIEADRSEEE